MHDAGKLWAGDGHGPYGASIVKQIFPDATDEQIMAIYQHMDKVPESAMGKLVKGADIAEDNPFRTFKQDSNILKQNSNQNGLTNGKILSDKIKEGYFNYTKG
nr:MAG TPA: activating signal cointegrator [Caudoviricetes sp.]DAN16628.1 MAG TPA: activating signal cointegrator [Bacteriophage sp.]DAN23239.1 MAG TPA_asm: activating signal cointegrator [Bacteriophage sp.]